MSADQTKPRTPYRLSAKLQGHQGDVRAVAAHTSPSGTDLILSASRDKTACVWARLPGNKHFEPPQVLGGHDGYVNACAWLSNGMGELYALTGGQDKLVNAFQVKVADNGTVSVSDGPDFSLIGHEDNISSIAVAPDGSYIVSGSWDKTVRVWRNWECAATFKEHLQAVWAVEVYKEDKIITASADKLIRLWSISKPEKPLIAWNSHTDAVRGLSMSPASPSDTFASCSNDGTISIFSLSAAEAGGTRPEQTLSGHTSFVYSLAWLPNGALASAGEDRTLRVWQDEHLAQTITIPAVSVWTVDGFDNGDLVCGSSDHAVWVFTAEPERAADADQIQAYEQTLASQALNKTQVDDVRKDQVPGKEALAQPGTKEGQTKMVKNGDVIEAYQWSVGSGRWEKVGEVVGGVGSGQKKLYEGKEYDYVFDVDIADDLPPLKLPYNLSENAYMAAQRFLERNELPMTYLEQVVGFIDKNTEATQIGASSEAYVDPFSGTGRYVPGGGYTSAAPASTPAPALPPKRNIIPQTSFLCFKQANLTALQTKLAELNGAHGSDVPAVDASLLLAQLQSAASKPSTSMDLSCLGSAVTSWPPSDRFPLLDLYRIAALHPSNASAAEIATLGFTASAWSDPWPSTPEEVKVRQTNTMLAARIAANLFNDRQSAGALTATPSAATQLLQTLHNPAFASFNKNGRVAYSTVIYNFSAAIAAQNAPQRYASSVLEVLTQILTEEDGDSEVVYRALVALGNLLVSKSYSSLPVGSVQLARDAAEAWGQRLGAVEERIAAILADIRTVS